MTFASLGLSAPILETITVTYTKPTPVQLESIPAILKGRDVMAAAQTGTGKTAGFTLPMLDLLAQGPRVRANQVRGLILVPTRELAGQVGDSVVRYGVRLPLRSAVVFGGVKINPQMMKLRKGVDILVATPGRLLDLHQQNAVRFNQLEILVLDEADRMLDMGFMDELKKILALLPVKRQNLMFSATYSDEIRALAKTIVHHPVEICVNPANSTATTIEHCLYPVDKQQKNALLKKLIKDNDWQQVLVFCKTKQAADRLVRFLEQQAISAAAIHGDKSQGARTRALSEFKNSQVQVLVATDLAARGLDIPQLPQVVNYDLPHVAQDYIHRIGRTGRAGVSGQAVSLVCADEFDELAAVERVIQQLITRKIMEGLEPAHALPESRLDTRPIKPKKLKKPKKPKTGASGAVPPRDRT
nr:DEAD/DEAH box helicase [Mariprofundus ferrooxydans]